MNQDLIDLLNNILIGVPVGLLLRKQFPSAGKRFAKWSLDKRWALFLFGALFQAGFSAMAFSTGKPFYGWFSIGFCLLTIWALFTYGLTPISKEQTERIDHSDPTKLIPFRFWT